MQLSDRHDVEAFVLLISEDNLYNGKFIKRGAADKQIQQQDQEMFATFSGSEFQSQK